MFSKQYIGFFLLNSYTRATVALLTLQDFD